MVTARKREETLQEIPVAVSAFSGENLTELGIRNISDLTKVVPNVDMYSGNGTTGSGKKASHTYETPGTYEVTLWVTDNGGKQHSLTKPVVVK